MGDYVILRTVDERLRARPAAVSERPTRERRLSAKPAAAAQPVHLEKSTLTKSEARELSRDPDVKAFARVMPTALVKPMGDLAAPAAAGAGATWGVSAVKAESDRFIGRDVSVAVLDTGIVDHPAFAGIKVTARDFTGESRDPELAPDLNGHGTHCAGTICGRPVNSTAIGVAPGVDKLLVGKVLGREGGDTRMLFDGLQWAVSQGANIVSMSLSFDFPGMVDGLVKDGWPVPQATSRALEAYRQNLRFFDNLVRSLQASPWASEGVLIIAATGNESVGGPKPMRLSAGLPAASEGICAVGALGRADSGTYAVADFSNSLARFVAPGVDIVSAAPGGGLASLSGTSMATPHVAGVAARWWEWARGRPHGGEVTIADRVYGQMIATATCDDLGVGVAAADVGYGLVQGPS